MCGVCDAQKTKFRFIAAPFPMISYGKKCFLGQCVCVYVEAKVMNNGHDALTASQSSAW